MKIGMMAILISMVYQFIICIIYFSKKRLENADNKTYALMLIINFIGLMLELSCYITAPYYNDNILLINFFNRAFLIYIIIWSYLLFKYTFVELFSTSRKIKNINKIIINVFTVCIALVYIVCAFIAIISKLYIYNDNQFTYSYGIAASVTLIPCFISFIVSLLIVLADMKNINLKKLIPLFTLTIILGLCLVLREVNPGYLFITPMLSFITFIMYFTIENPDLQMIEQLNIERDRADKANNAKTEFLSSMSHEIRTPLNAIDGFSQLILEEDNIDVIKDEARDIMAASQNLLEIVNGILDISKIEADKLEIVNVEYEPSKIFHDVGKLAKSRIGEKPVEFKEHIAEDLPDYLNGDYTRIKQITLNLLTNAVKYTKDGYVDYSVRCVRQDDICRLIIMVKDTGIGIKKQNVDKLFQKFERFDKEQNITIEGTGLGLAITKRLVELMNGRIIADSIYGTGSIFAVVIDQKIVNKKKEEVKEQTNEVKTSFAGKKILIVDDNKINLKVASRLLASYSIITEEVLSGFECIDKINAGNKYDLILMDDMMPKMSGTETLKKLKALENFKTPVIALTANAIAGMKENYLKEGFNDYISKPIDKKELESVLNKYLN